MRGTHRRRLFLALFTVVVSGCGLAPYGDCVVSETQQVDDEELLEGASFTAREAKDILGSYVGEVKWPGGAEELLSVELSKTSPSVATSYENPTVCPISYSFDVVGSVVLGDDGRYFDEGALGTAMVRSTTVGSVVLDVDLGELGGLRIPSDFDPADYEESWIEVELSWNGSDLDGGGTWKGVNGDERASADCCTVSLGG